MTVHVRVTQASADASVGLINTGPVSLELTIDDPVTSGSDGPVGN